MRSLDMGWLKFQCWQRWAARAAIAVLVLYLYSPVEVTSMLEGTPGGPDESAGWNDVFSSVTFFHVSMVVMPMTFTAPGSAPRLVNLPDWPAAVRELIFVAGLVTITQLPLIPGRAGSLSRRVRIAFVCLFVLCAAERLWDANDRREHRYIGGYVRYGIWLPPIFFTLAACAVMSCRRTGRSSEPGENDPSRTPARL